MGEAPVAHHFGTPKQARTLQEGRERNTSPNHLKGSMIGGDIVQCAQLGVLSLVFNIKGAYICDVKNVKCEFWFLVGKSRKKQFSNHLSWDKARMGNN